MFNDKQGGGVMGDLLIMSKKELKRKALLEGFRYKKLTLTECAERLDVSYRQIKRIWQRYQAEMDAGLCHKNRGKTPHNAYSDDFKVTILDLYRSKYLEFGPTLASEVMEEQDSVIIHPETLRLWLKKEGLWTRKRKHKIYRERRERRSCFGDMLQIDGSIHDWFSNGKNDCLLNMVDDATGMTFALLDTGETTQILLTCLKRWIEKYGIPKSVYVDLKSVYVGFKKLKDQYDDDCLNDKGFSVFEQVCKKLDIQIIRAYSPQAKGRVERKHRVFQDRFVKMLGVHKIKKIEAANIYLEETFLNKINKKAVAPKEKEDAHRDPKSYGDLNEIICWQYQRQIKNDWSIRFKNEYFQLREPTEKNLIQPGQLVTLKKYLNGDIRFWFEDIMLKHGALSRKPRPPSESKQYHEIKESVDPILQAQILRKNSLKSSWRQTNALLYKNKKPVCTHQKSIT